MSLVNISHNIVHTIRAAFFVNIPDRSLSLPSMNDSLASFQGMASIPCSLCMAIELGSDEDDLKFVFVIQFLLFSLSGRVNFLLPS